MDQTQDSCYIILPVLGYPYRNKWNQIYSVRKDVYIENVRLGLLPFSLRYFFLFIFFYILLGIWEEKVNAGVMKSISQIFHIYVNVYTTKHGIMMSWRYLKCETVNRNISDLDIFIESAYWMRSIFLLRLSIFICFVWRDAFQWFDWELYVCVFFFSFMFNAWKFWLHWKAWC